MTVLAVTAAAGQSVSGVVLDPSGAPVAHARVAVLTPEGLPVADAVTSQAGEFAVPAPARGTYRVRAEAPGFHAAETSRQLSAESRERLELRLSLAPVNDGITVTAERGSAVDATSSPQFTSVRDRAEFLSRPIATSGHALQDAPGVLIQTTTHGHASPVLRGLTGYQTLILFDGVRFNTSIFRSGPNQYMSFIDPSQAGVVEALLGPAGAAYGSDALGGVVSVLSRPARFCPDATCVTGEARAMAASADASLNTGASVAVGGRNLWWMIAGSARRLNDLRAGRGHDSHHVFRRYFGLTQDTVRDLLGPRLQDTAFFQSGLQTKFAWRIAPEQDLTALFQRSGLSGLRSYRDQWGGAGRLQALFEPQDGHLGYLRWERRGLGPVDSLSARFSINRIRDGSVRQGLNFTDVLTDEVVGSDVYGVSAQAATHIGRNLVQLFGVEHYEEVVTASGLRIDAATRSRSTVRPPMPDGSRYRNFGMFAQNTAESFSGRLRTTVGLRWTRASFSSPSDPAFGVAPSSFVFDDWSFQAGSTWQLTQSVGLHGSVSRGFRAPNSSDLAAIGLSSLGYEVPAADAAGTGALLGSSASDAALPVGRSVSPLRPETLWSGESGFSVRTRRLSARAQAFLAAFEDPVGRRTLLYPLGGAPAVLAGQSVTQLAPTAAQRQAGLAGVATAFDPRAVKAIVNDGAVRYSGFEGYIRLAVAERWSLSGAYSFLAGRVLDPNRPVRRLSPQNGYAALRYLPSGRRPWLELRGTFAGPQTRLAPDDLDDERIGASRSRDNIAAFFNGGLVSPYRSGGVFTPTGETLRQIQDRVLPLGAVINGAAVVSNSARVPLFASVPGWVSADVIGGYPLSERIGLNFGVTNLLDKNYRVIGSGVDMPGINAFAGVQISF